MAFGNLFGGYCVIHAPFAVPQRRPVCEAELRRVGVTDLNVVEAHRIPADDPRAHQFRSPAELSLVEATIRAIELAEAKGWPSVAIFEDDVLFRPRFLALWASVEDEVRQTYWDVLTLHKWPFRDRVVVERMFGRTVLKPLRRGTLCTHAFFVRREAYATALMALRVCRDVGKPTDFFFGYVSRVGGKVMATSRNLAGQTSHASVSSVTGARNTRRVRHMHFTQFGSYRGWPEFAAANAARAVLRLGRRLRRAAGG